MKPPAYGRSLLDARRRGLRPAPPFDVVFVTDDWELANGLDPNDPADGDADDDGDGPRPDHQQNEQHHGEFCVGVHLQM